LCGHKGHAKGHAFLTTKTSDLRPHPTLLKGWGGKGN